MGKSEWTDQQDPNESTEENAELSESSLLLTSAQNSKPASPLPKTETELASRAYVPLEIICFLYFFSSGLAGPATTFYVYTRIGDKYAFNSTHYTPIGWRNSTINNEMSIQQETSTMIMTLSFVSSFASILPTVILGSLTDRYGRKLATYLAISGTSLKQAIYIVIFTFQADINFLFIGNFIEGICGQSGALMVSLFAAVADITEPGKERAFRITSIEASLFMAIAISIGVSGVWVSEAGFLTPFYAMLATSVLNLAVAILFLPETRKDCCRRFSLSRLLQDLKQSFRFYFVDTESKRRWKLQICLLAFFGTFSVSAVYSNVMALFLLKSPFHWSMVKITAYTAIKLIVDWLCILLLTRRFGHVISDINIAIVGCVSSSLGMLMVGIATDNDMIYVSAVLGLFTEAVTPMLRSIMSRQVTGDEQGALFGSISVIETVSGAAFGLIVSAGYKASLHFFPGLVFVCLSGLVMAVACLLGFLSWSVKKSLRSHPQL